MQWFSVRPDIQRSMVQTLIRTGKIKAKNKSRQEVPT